MRNFVRAEGIWLEPMEHRYARRDGRVLIGVSEALQGVRIIDDRWLQEEEYALEGTAVHSLVAQALADPGLLRHRVLESPWWGPYAGYGRSLLAFLDSALPVTVATELLIAYQHLPCAGTLDWVGVWNDAVWVVDWKTGVECRWHALQTAGYGGALERIASEKLPIRRAALYLHEDGAPARLRVHYKPSDHTYFQAAVSCNAFRLGLV